MPHVTFIHGIANKPAPDVLIRLWRDSLARDEGIDLGAEGVTSDMVYWADVLYGEPKREMAEHESNDSIVEAADEEPDMSWQDELESDELQWVDSLASKMNYDAPPPQGDETFTPEAFGDSELEANFERIPLPWWLKRRLMKMLLRDVHHYLFNVEFQAHPDRPAVRVQDEIRQRMISALAQGAEKPGPHVVISHSMGTVIAYDCLKRVADCPRVDALMTIGSPLGLDEVQDKLQPGWSREDGFPSATLKDRWVNVFDRLDVVAAFDPEISNDYRKGGDRVIDDLNEQNWGTWRHNISNYLAGAELRGKLQQMLEL
jgi:hypothetical protein